MADERKWQLGEDLATYDTILDGITFDDLILTLHCNVPKSKMTVNDVTSELLEILDGRLEDMWFLIEKNADKIVEYAKNYYRDE